MILPSRATPLKTAILLGIFLTITVAALSLNPFRTAIAVNRSVLVGPVQQGLGHRSNSGPARPEGAHQPFVTASGGKAILIESAAGEPRFRRLTASLPVFKAFGYDGNGLLLYSPLKNGRPSGELYLEDLVSKTRRKVTSRVVLSASLSPVNPSHVAYTFAGGSSFGLGFTDLETGKTRTLVHSGVYSDTIQWDGSGKGLHYFDTRTERAPLRINSPYDPDRPLSKYGDWDSDEVAQLLAKSASETRIGISPGFVPISADNSESVQDELPVGFPKLEKHKDLPIDFLDDPRQVDAGENDLNAFTVSSPDGAHHVTGKDLTSAGILKIVDRISGDEFDIGKGQLLGVHADGVVVRQFSPSATILKFVGWDGVSSELGSTAVNYNVPISSGLMVQGGASYPAPGSCGITAHSDTLGYAYDFQGVVGAHALAAADGLVVFGNQSVTCNFIDTDCPDYSQNICPGFYLGNVIVIQHADGTYSSFAHLEANSFQVAVGTSVCQGLYVARQGHTGSTAGNFNLCGDHIHFQRQVSADPLSQSIPVDFADVQTEPLSCGTTYNSSSTEITHTIAATSQHFAISGGNGNVSVSSNGCSWNVVSNDSWITVTSPSTGSGNGTVLYSVSDNSSSGSRSGTLNIGGRIFTVTQDGGGATNAAPVVSAGPDQTITLPSIASLAGTATDDGLPLPVSLTTTWSKVSGPGAVTFGNATSQNTTADFSMSGIYVLRLSASDGALSSADDIRIIVNVSGAGGMIAGAMSAQPASVNLTTEGSLDWAHWGLNDAGTFTHKNGVVPQISDITRIGSVVTMRSSGCTPTISWSDGTPTGSISNADPCVFTYGVDNGYELTVPADTNQRTLKLYVSAWRSAARMEAFISDGSASPFVDNSLAAVYPNGITGVYTLNYSAASPGQTLTVRLVIESNSYPVGNLALKAATLSSASVPANTAPAVNAGLDQAITLPASASLAGTVTDDGLPSPPNLSTTWTKVSGPGTVTFGNSGQASTTADFSLAGIYVLRLTSSDGLLSAADDVTVVVNTTSASGVLGGSQTLSPTNVNLTTEGTSDWAHWGMNNSASAFNHKASGGNQISNYISIGTGSPQGFGGAVNYAWTDGSPTGSANVTNGVFVFSVGNGFELTAPAGSSARTLKLYVGAFKATGRLTATLSDGSASPYIDTSLTNQTGATNVVYTLNYQAASDGQTLTVRWTNDAGFDPQFSNVTLQAATLQGGIVSPPNQAPSVDAGSETSGAINTLINLNGTVTDDGLPAPPALTTTWSKVSGPGNVVFSDPSAVDTSALFDLAGVYFVRLTANDGALQASDDVRIVVNNPSGGGALSGSQGVPPNNVDLSAEGTLDWAHWGRGSATAFNHKTGANLISNFSSIGTGTPQQFSSASPIYTWNNGTPTAAGSTSDGVFVFSAGNGFQISAPADTNLRTLRIYAGVWRATGRLEATLSDGSSSPYIDTSLSNQAGSTTAGVFVLNYQAASAGQTLLVRWTNDFAFDPQFSNVTLQAATLQGFVTPVNQAPTVNAGVDQTLDIAGQPQVQTSVVGAASDDGLPAPPNLTTTWSTVSGPAAVGFGSPNALNSTVTFTASGVYVLRLTANDGSLQSADDISITVNNSAGGGTITGGQTASPANVDLTGEGTSDWAHWGLASVASAFNHKSAGGIQISNYTSIGTGTPQGFGGNSVNYAWTDGTPTASANSVNGVFVFNANNGFQLTAPADTNIRTLKVYVSVFKATGKMEATLSDGSTVPFVDTSLTNQTGATNAVYTLTYAAASAGQVLTLKWTNNAAFDPQFSNVTLQAATLQGMSAPSNQPPAVNAGSDGTGNVNSAINLDGTVTDDGLPAPPAVTALWSKVNGPGNVAFGNPTSVDTTATFDLAGVYDLRLTANDGVLSGSDLVQIVVNNPGGTGSLSGSQIVPPANVDLSAEGTLDWAHWGFGGNPLAFNHKASGLTQISNFSTLSGSPSAYATSITAFSWNDGTPSPAAANTIEGVFVLGPDNGFQISVAADTTPRILKLYVGTYEATGRLEASLSDGSASPYVDMSVTGTAPTPKAQVVYTIPYRAASAGQTLNLKWKKQLALGPGSNVTLQAAALTVPAPTNQPPLVSAGPDQTLALPSGASLAGTASDDGLPNPPSVLSTSWTQISGPGTVSFGDAAQLNTTAAFSAAGVYVLRLTANDSSLSAFDEMTVTVTPANQAPIVNAGTDQSITLPGMASLAGTATDDGLPNPPASLATAWSKVSGPGTVTFGNAGQLNTTASFSVAGVYVLRLTADDTLLSTADELTITVGPANQPPVVNAGGDQAITLPASASLSGTASDDGLPMPSNLTFAWSKVTGPGSVSFSPSNSLTTAASFGSTGVFVLRLTVNDGGLSTSDDVSVTVAASISGQVNYGIVINNQVKPVSNVTVTATGPAGTQTLTDSAGNYILTGLSGGNYTVTPSKSGNVNGAVSTLDATRVLQHLAQITTLSPNQQIAGDATNNGSLSTLDASRILQTVALIPNTGIAGQWKFIQPSRTYNNISDSQTGQDYEAILVGDVTGNWTSGTPLAENSGLTLPGKSGNFGDLLKFSGSDPLLTGIDVTLPTDARAMTGSVATIPITIANNVAPGFSGYRFELLFDPTVLQPTLTPATSAGTLSTGMSIQVNTSIPGKIIIAAAGSQQITNSGTLLNLNFDVVGTNPGPTSSTSLTWGAFVFDEGTPAAKPVAGQFTVLGPTAASVPVSGRVRGSNGSGHSFVIIRIADDQGNVWVTNTNSFGFYRFENIPVGSTYIVSARSRHYAFSPSAHVIAVFDEFSNVDFLADQ